MLAMITWASQVTYKTEISGDNEIPTIYSSNAGIVVKPIEKPKRLHFQKILGRCDRAGVIQQERTILHVPTYQLRGIIPIKMITEKACGRPRKRNSTSDHNAGLDNQQVLQTRSLHCCLNRSREVLWQRFARDFSIESL